MSMIFNGKKKCLTFSYDDGVRQDIRLIEIFKKYGMKGTFNLNSGNLGYVGHITHYGFDVCFDKMKPDEVYDLYTANGMEVAVHGKNHRNFPELSESALDEEILEDKARLEELSKQKILGAAYPCGVFDETMTKRLTSRGINFCRTIADTHGFDVPENLIFWHPTCHDNDERVFELAKSFIEYKGEKPMLFYIWGHAFELDKNDKDRWYNMEKLCDMLSGKNDVSYQTNGEILIQKNTSDKL